MIKNKRGQALSIIFFFAIIVSVFIVSFILMMVVQKTLTPFQSSIGNVTAKAGTNVGYIQSSFTTWWDYAVMFIFFINIVILFTSAFFVDIHPSFFVLYIFACLFLVIFGYSMLTSMDAIKDKMNEILTPTSLSVLMPMTNWMADNFNMVMLGIIILSGIVMYAKFKYFGGQY